MQPSYANAQQTYTNIQPSHANIQQTYVNIQQTCVNICKRTANNVISTSTPTESRLHTVMNGELGEYAQEANCRLHVWMCAFIYMCMNRI